LSRSTQTTPINPQSRALAWFPTALSQLDTARTPQSYPSNGFIGAQCPSLHNQIHSNRCVQPRQRQQQQQYSSATLGVQHLLSTDLHRAKHLLRSRIIYVRAYEKVAVLLPKFDINISHVYKFVGSTYDEFKQRHPYGKVDYLREPEGWYTPFDNGVRHCTTLGLLEPIQALHHAQRLYSSADEEDGIISSVTDSRDAHGKESVR
ncbi:hypothetical protein LTR92_011783, partial [Exophiala xenobiotica]